MKLKMSEEIDDELREYFSGVVGLIEANSYEHQSLWEDWCGRWEAVWKSAQDGRMRAVGSIGDRQICISLRVDTVNSKRILFWYATSQLVDHELIDKWLERAMPDTARTKDGRLNTTDSTNAHIVFN